MPGSLGDPEVAAAYCWFTNRPKGEHTLEQSYSGMYSKFQQLRLFYEQQEGKQSVSDQSIISILDHQEQLLLYKSQNSRKQAVLSSYFT